MQAHRSDTLETYKLRPEFYRRLYRVVLRVVLINSFVLAGLCALTVYLGFYGFKPEHYFTTTPTGKLVAIKYKLAPPFSGNAPPAPLAPKQESPQSSPAPTPPPANAQPAPQ